MVTARFVLSPPMATNRTRNGGQFLRQAVPLLLLPLLLLAICLPASAVSVLKSLTIAKPVIFGIGSTTGTVTLSATSTTATSVVLKSGNANVHVPATVSVNAGSLTATFTISTVAAFATPASVTISGAAGGWLQSAVLAGVAATYSVSIQNLYASSGNGCVLLMWHDLEVGSYRGFNIYKISGATATKLNATPQTYALYAITGLTNGTTYQYAVSVVNAAGVESARSATVSAIPSAAIEKLSWILPPTTATGSLVLYASTPLDTVSATRLLVDGAKAGDVGGTNDASGHTGQQVANVDTTFLTNGTHTFQIIGFVGSHSCATPPQSILVTNDFSGVGANNFVVLDDGDMCAIQATFPSGTTSWTVQVLNGSDIVLRTWSGTTASTQLSWDGTDSTGVVQAGGDYTVQLTALDAQGQQKQTKKHIALVKGSPNALVLVNGVDTDSVADITTLVNTIEKQLLRIQGNNPGFTYSVYYSPVRDPLSNQAFRKIRAWMGSTVTDFYLYGHGLYPKNGEPGEAKALGAIFWGGSLTEGTTAYDNSLGQPDSNIVIKDATKGRQYNFAMMDCCFGAGGIPAGTSKGKPSSTVDNSFHDAFNIGSDINFASAFVGWDGYSYLNTNLDGSTGKVWLPWRIDFWTALGDGKLVKQAVDFAMTNAKASITFNPWDAPPTYLNTRSQFIGDQETPFP